MLMFLFRVFCIFRVVLASGRDRHAPAGIYITKMMSNVAAKLLLPAVP